MPLFKVLLHCHFKLCFKENKGGVRNVLRSPLTFLVGLASWPQNNSHFHYKDATLEQDRYLHMQMATLSPESTSFATQWKENPTTFLSHLSNTSKKPLKCVGFQGAFSPSLRVPQSSHSKQINIIPAGRHLPGSKSLFHGRKMHTEKSRKRHKLVTLACILKDKE